MSPMPRCMVELDDITLWHMHTGCFKVEAPTQPLHHPHALWLIAPRGGGVSLLTEDVSCESRPLLLSPVRDHVIAVEGNPLSIELPSYRLGISPLSEHPYHLYASDQGHLIQAMLDELMLTGERLDPSSQRYVAQALSDLLLYREESPTPPDTALGRAEALMDQRYREHALRAEDIAEALGISRAGLYRLLSPYGGFKTCLHALRLDRVARLLRNPQHDSKPIKGLLFHNGFSSTEQFQRLFRQRFGVAARDFRKGARSPTPARWQLALLPNREAPWSISR
ncbi:MAG: helix-turn-helix domain-containing protein [Pseudomonadota bacterium]